MISKYVIILIFRLSFRNEKLKNYFGYKVKIDSNKKHQKLVIEYDDEDGLESLLSKLNIEM